MNSMIQRVSAAIQNMLVMTYGKGIGSCWFTAPLETGIDEELSRDFAPKKGEIGNGTNS